jgi:hypothetical protein
VIARLFELIPPKDPFLVLAGITDQHLWIVRIVTASFAFILIGVLGACMRHPHGALLVALAFSSSYWAPGLIELCFGPGPINWAPVGFEGVVYLIAQMTVMQLAATWLGFMAGMALRTESRPATRGARDSPRV